MAGYFSPTVIQETIPAADMTPLELLLLSHIFDAEQDGDGWYFFSAQGPSDLLYIARRELEAALAASQGAGENVANTFVIEQLSAQQTADPPPSHRDLDLSTTSWEFIMQDVVRRSAALSYVAAVSAFTCIEDAVRRFRRRCDRGFGRRNPRQIDARPA